MALGQATNIAHYEKLYNPGVIGGVVDFYHSCYMYLTRSQNPNIPRIFFQIVATGNTPETKMANYLAVLKAMMHSAQALHQDMILIAINSYVSNYYYCVNIYQIPVALLTEYIY